MGTRERVLEQLQKLWRLALEVLKFEVDLKWLDSIYEDDNIRDEEKTRRARVQLLKMCFELCKHERRIKTLIDEIKNDSVRDERKEDEALQSAGDSKGDYV